MRSTCIGCDGPLADVGHHWKFCTNMDCKYGQASRAWCESNMVTITPKRIRDSRGVMSRGGRPWVDWAGYDDVIEVRSGSI